MSVTAIEAGVLRTTGARRPVRIGLAGCGRVGEAVLSALDRLNRSRVSRPLECAVALVRDPIRPRRLPAGQVTTSVDQFLASGLDVVVEAMGGVEAPYAVVAASLDAGLHVVTCNKSLVARHGPALADRAARRGVGFAYDAAVMAGVPFVGALARRPSLGAVNRISGIVNGTSHYVVSAMARGASAGQAITEAVARGYAEPDPSADLGGLDAAEKLAILLHLSGHTGARVDGIRRHGLDGLETADLAGAALLGGTIKPIAHASLDHANAGAWVGPAFVPSGHLLAAFAGVECALELRQATGEAIAFCGPGAGPDVTAATVVDDVVETISGVGAGRPEPPVVRRPAGSMPCPRLDVLGPEAWTRPPRARWFVRVSGRRELTACDAVRLLEDISVPCERVVADRVGVYALTGPLAHDAIERARACLHSRGARAAAWLAIEPRGWR